MTTKPGDDLTGLFFDCVKKAFAYVQGWGMLRGQQELTITRTLNHHDL